VSVRERKRDVRRGVSGAGGGGSKGVGSLKTYRYGEALRQPNTEERIIALLAFQASFEQRRSEQAHLHHHSFTSSRTLDIIHYYYFFLPANCCTLPFNCITA
jgi:hypothetical protein